MTSRTNIDAAYKPPSHYTVGIDSIVIMKDVCGLDDDEALEVLLGGHRTAP